MVAIALVANASFAADTRADKSQKKVKGPVKVFILVGQSNMQGPAKISTFDYIGEDPATAPLLKMMRGADGKPTVCDGVWISYLTGSGTNNFTVNGKLTAGYGAMSDPAKLGDKIGPEFTFGLTMDALLDEPVLIIKAAWGGRNLHTDFRSPSAGPFVIPEAIQKYLDKNPKPEEKAKWTTEKVAATGVYYRLMIEHVKKVLADPKQVMPEYDPSQGTEIAGFVWFQGFNDMVDGQVYPKHPDPDQHALYTELLVHFIRDVRKDLNAPKMPFVVGVMGVGGLTYRVPSMLSFRKAMAAPAEMPEFKGNVVNVHTAQYFADEIDINAMRVKVDEMRRFLETKHKDYANADGSMTPEQQKEYVKKFEAELITPEVIAANKRGACDLGYHYMGCAKIFARIGQGFAEALKPFLKSDAK